MVKLRLGEFLKCKGYEAQRNELMMKFICHNICCLIQEIYERGIHVDFRDCLNDYVERKVEDDEVARYSRNDEISKDKDFSVK